MLDLLFQHSLCEDEKPDHGEEVTERYVGHVTHVSNGGSAAKKEELRRTTSSQSDSKAQTTKDSGVTVSL